MSIKNYKNLILSMMRSGVLGFGGGPAVIPLFQHDAVHVYKWMTDKEFSDLVGISNALPGPIATKLAAQIGYKMNGVLGAILAILAHILPTSLGVIFFMGIIYTYKDTKIVEGMINAVKPVVTVLLAIIAYDFMKKAIKSLRLKIAGISFLIAFILLISFNIHPAIIICLFIFYGAFHYKIQKFLNKRFRKESL